MTFKKRGRSLFEKDQEIFFVDSEIERATWTTQLYANKRKAGIRAKEMIEKIRKADKIAIPMEPMMVLRGNRSKKSAKFRVIQKGPRR